LARAPAVTHNARDMAPPSVGSVWVNHQSSDPNDLVNRNAERKKLFKLLTEHLAAGNGQGRILVTGDRGVGKSILTRAVIDEFVRANQDCVVSVRVNGRGVGYRAFLQTFARDLAQALRPHAKRWNKTDVDRWLDELVAFTNASQISRAQAESLARRYGAGADVTGDALIYKIAAKFTWEETRSLGVTHQSVLNVTDELLHEAIAQTLERLRAAEAPISIVVFYDDLDQAFSTGAGADVESAMQRVLELQPCIAVAHIRSEALSANVRRVITNEVSVGPLPPSELLAVLRRRVETTKNKAVKTTFKTELYKPFEQLASITGNALAFLKWTQAFLSLWDVDAPADWRSDAHLRELALEATPTGGIDASLLADLARLVDACTLPPHHDGCRFDDLVRGVPDGQTPPRVAPLTKTELETLETLGLLIKRNQFAERAVYRVEPTLDLLRPSIAQKLRAAP
jgi:hypothetical protein